MLERLQPEEILKICPSLFSWLSRVLLKSCPAAFDCITSWFEANHKERKSLLVAELETRPGDKNILNELIEEKRIEIVWKIKEMSTEEFWTRLASERSTVGQQAKDYGYAAYYRNYHYDDDLSENEEFEKSESIVHTYLPFFAALKSN